jgi:hypothetical protein
MNMRNLIIGILLVVPFSVMADEVEDQIKQGLQAYHSQDYRAAVDELNYAIAYIQEKLNSQNAELLPKPLKGWTASEIENASGAMSMMGMGSHMSRSYQRGNERIEISITAGSPMVAGALAMINNPMIISSNPNMKPFRYHRIKGIKEVSGKRIEITLAIAGQIMIQLAGSNTDEAAIKQYLDAMNFEGIKKSFLQ